MCEGFIKFFEVKEKQLKQNEKNKNEESRKNAYMSSDLGIHILE